MTTTLKKVHEGHYGYHTKHVTCNVTDTVIIGRLANAKSLEDKKMTEDARTVHGAVGFALTCVFLVEIKVKGKLSIKVAAYEPG